MQRPSQAACRFYTAFYRWNILTSTSSTHHLDSHRLSYLPRRAQWQASRHLSTTKQCCREHRFSHNDVPNRSIRKGDEYLPYQNRRESWKSWLNRTKPEPSSQRPFDTLEVWEDVIRHRSSAGVIVQTCVPASTVRDLERVYGEGLKDIAEELFDGDARSISVEVGSDFVEKELLGSTDPMKVRSVLYSGTFEDVEKVRMKLGSVSGQRDDDEESIGHEARGERGSGLVRGLVSDDGPSYRERRERRGLRQDGPVRRIMERDHAIEMRRNNERSSSGKRGLDYDTAIQQSQPTPPPMSDTDNPDSKVPNWLLRPTSFSSLPTRSIKSFQFFLRSRDSANNQVHISTVIPSTAFRSTGLWHNYVAEPNRLSVGADISVSTEFTRVDRETNEKKRFREVEIRGTMEQALQIKGGITGVRKSLSGGDGHGIRVDGDSITGGDDGRFQGNGWDGKAALRELPSPRTSQAPPNSRLISINENYTPLPSWLLTPSKSRTQLPTLGLSPLQPILRDRSRNNQTLHVEIVVPANEKWDQEVMQLLQQPRDASVSVDLESPFSRVDESTGESHWRRPLMLRGTAEGILSIVDDIEEMRRRVLGLVQSNETNEVSSDRVVDVPAKHVRRAARRDEIASEEQAALNNTDGALYPTFNAAINDARVADTAAARSTSSESSFPISTRLAIPAATANGVFTLIQMIKKDIEHATGPRTCDVMGEEDPDVDLGERFLKVWAADLEVLSKARGVIARAVRRVAKNHGIDGIVAGKEVRRVLEERGDIGVAESDRAEDAAAQVGLAREGSSVEGFPFSIRLSVPAPHADGVIRLVPNVENHFGTNKVRIIAEPSLAHGPDERRFLRVYGRTKSLLRAADRGINGAVRRAASESGVDAVENGIRTRPVDDEGRETDYVKGVRREAAIAAVSETEKAVDAERNKESVKGIENGLATALDSAYEEAHAQHGNPEAASEGVTASQKKRSENAAVQSGALEPTTDAANDSMYAGTLGAPEYPTENRNEPNANANLASAFDEAVRNSMTAADAADTTTEIEMHSFSRHAGAIVNDQKVNGSAVPFSEDAAASSADSTLPFSIEIAMLTRHADHVISKMSMIKDDIARGSPEDECAITSGPSGSDADETIFKVSASSEEALRHVRSRIASYARVSFVKEGAKPGHIEIRARDGRRWVVEDASITVTELEVRASSILPMYCRFATPLRLAGHVLKRGTKIRDAVHYKTSKEGGPVQANDGSGIVEQHFLLWASGSRDIRDGKEYLRKLMSRLVADHYPNIDAKSAIRFLEQGIDEGGHARGEYAYVSSLSKGREPSFSNFCSYCTFTLPLVTLEDINLRVAKMIRSTRCQLQRLAPPEVSVEDLPENQERRLYTLWGKSEELVKRARDMIEKSARESLDAQGEDGAALSVVQEGVSDVTLGKLMEEAVGMETTPTEKVALDGTADESAMLSTGTDPLSAGSEMETYFEGAEDSEPTVEDDMIFPEFNPPFADDFAMERPPESRSSSLNLLTVSASDRASKRPLQQRAYSTSTRPQTRKPAAQGASEYSAAAANDAQEGADPEIAKDNQLIDDIKHTLRTVTHPVVVVTSRLPLPRTLTKGIDERLDCCRGVTVSSFNTVTLTPTPIVSLNLRVPSRTWDAMCKSKQFSIHVVSATPEGAGIAHAFTQPYDQPSEPFRRLEQLGVNIYVETRNAAARNVQPPRLSWSNAVMARIDALLMPEACVNVGDHVIVVAKAIRVQFPPKEKGNSDRVVDEQVALAYAKQGYRTVGDRVTQVDLPDLPEQERPREPQTESTTEANVGDDVKIPRDAVGESKPRSASFEPYFGQAEAGEKADGSVPRLPKAATRQTLKYSNPPPIPQSRPKRGSQNAWGISGTAKSSYSTLAVHANRGAGVLRHYSTTSTILPPDAQRGSRRSPMEQVSDPEILSSSVASFLGVPEQDDEDVPKYRIHGLMRLQKEARVASHRLERALADGSLTPGESSRLENIIVQNERRIAKVLALRSAKDLRRLLDRGRVDYNQVQWLETNIEKGQAVLLEEARQLRRLLNEKAISEEQFQMVKEKLALQHQTLTAEATRLRQMVDEDSEGGGAIDRDFDGFRGNV